VIKVVGQTPHGGKVIGRRTQTAKRPGPIRARFMARTQHQTMTRRLQFQAIRPAAQSQFKCRRFHGIILNDAGAEVNESTLAAGDGVLRGPNCCGSNGLKPLAV
jgi:hypothetical protein